MGEMIPVFFQQMEGFPAQKPVVKVNTPGLGCQGAFKLVLAAYRNMEALPGIVGHLRLLGQKRIPFFRNHFPFGGKGWFSVPVGKPLAGGQFLFHCQHCLSAQFVQGTDGQENPLIRFNPYCFYMEQAVSAFSHPLFDAFFGQGLLLCLLHQISLTADRKAAFLQRKLCRAVDFQAHIGLNLLAKPSINIFFFNFRK